MHTLCHALQARAGGALPPGRLEAAVSYARAKELAEGGSGVALGAQLFARSPAAAPLLCLRLDSAASRFLLATDTASGVHLYDAAAPRRGGGGTGASGGDRKSVV